MRRVGSALSVEHGCPSTTPPPLVSVTHRRRSRRSEVGMARQRPRRTQPVRAPSGGPYGQRSQLESAQRAIPLPASEGTTGAAPPVPAGTPPPVSAGGAPATPPTAVVPPTTPDLHEPDAPHEPGPANPHP